MPDRTRHPWPQQSKRPGVVHVARVPATTTGDNMAKAARQYAARNQLRVQAVVFGEYVVTRWTPIPANDQSTMSTFFGV